MRYCFLFSILLLLFACAGNTSRTNESPIDVHAEIIRAFDSTYIFDSTIHKTYNIKLSIKNISQQPISYWAMTCSWTYNWITNKDNYSLIGPHSCDSNFPFVRHLNPNESFTYNDFVFETGNQLFTNENNLKLGFIYIDSIQCKGTNDYRKIIGDKSIQKIVWSNPLDLK